ncbi:Folliculin [Niveomyces insectorum RCEF 264]|uniref:Folliculin n=1 Tax=Niveomyces insectorum RCEF 264 TaxID=1081102 RepID=A0A167X9D2_9HYPO|nr:Folliculin [Niveomyces insectorum RCEF 264]
MLLKLAPLQLCLAHFCEVHGPTPLMVTEGLPSKCSTCEDPGDDVPGLVSAVASAMSSLNSSPSSASTTHAAATAATAAVADALRKMSLTRTDDTASSRSRHQSNGTAKRSPPRAPTPFKEPQLAASASPLLQTRDDSPTTTATTTATTTTMPTAPISNFSKTYDESVTKRALPCDNCAMTLPRPKTKTGHVVSAAGDAGGTDARNPTLCTRVPRAQVYDEMPRDASPFVLHPSSSSGSSSASSDAGGDERPTSRSYRRSHHQRASTATSAATSRSSTSSSLSRQIKSHTHYFEYTSTHEPVSPDAYGIVRASCLRTLTLETLPRSPASAATVITGSGLASAGGSLVTTPQPTTPSSLAAASYFTAFPHGGPSAAAAVAAAAAVNGGPLFFGDAATGYTTAHIFRVADVHARGHKRVYALIALNTQCERLAMQAFGFVSAAFNDLAAWIQQLADAEAERVVYQSESAGSSSPSSEGSPSTSANPSFGLGGSPHTSPPSTQPSSVTNDSGSSFLAAAGNGLLRRMGPGFSGFGKLGSANASSVRARGLPEILGKPDFFIELHARFVQLLVGLDVALSQA